MLTAVKFASIATLLLLVLLVSGATMCYLEIGSRRAPGLSREGLLSLRPGMAAQEVIERVGEPLQRTRSAVHAHQELWTYGEPGFCLEGLEVYVTMENGQLLSVNIEHFDLGAYRCNSQECPRILNSEDFEKTFRNRDAH